jgi:hypothetical protein
LHPSLRAFRAFHILALCPHTSEKELMSKVVFGMYYSIDTSMIDTDCKCTVGNVPYTMSEVSSWVKLSPRCWLRLCLQDALIDVFKSVGEVVGFR